MKKCYFVVLARQYGDYWISDYYDAPGGTDRYWTRELCTKCYGKAYRMVRKLQKVLGKDSVIIARSRKPVSTKGYAVEAFEYPDGSWWYTEW